MATVPLRPIAAEQQPIIIDLGKKRKKQIRNLKKGRGRLMADVADVVEEVRSSLGEEAKDKTIVPIVMIYRRKKRKRGGLLPLAF